MIRYFAAHPTAANIMMMALIAIGLASFPSLNRETLPDIKGDKVKVSVVYPGASPVDVEEGICAPLEDATDGISFLEEQSCVAQENVGAMTLTMQESGQMQAFIDDINAAVDAIDQFPESSENPVVEELGRTDQVVSVAVTSALTRSELKALAEHYRMQLLNLPDVSIVTIEGFSTHQLRVLISAEQLRAYRLSIDDVANRIRQQAKDLPAGVVETVDRHYQILFENQRRTVDELESLVIYSSDNSGEITLRDIATIEKGFSSVDQRIAFDGKPAALLTINKNQSEDALTVLAAVKAFVEAENRRLPESTRLIITQDVASIVEDRLKLLLKNGVQGLLLAGAVLLIFFNARYTFWIVMGLPVSFMGGLAVMSLLDITVNMISMIALLMAIGILMDDAMVISESIEAEHRHNPELTALEAVIRGVKKVLGGIFSSYLTSAMLFGSVLGLSGETGQIMSVLPKVLLAVLTISLIEAFLILPSHLSHALQTDQKPTWRQKVDDTFDKMRAVLGRWADAAIQFRYAVVGLAIAFFLVTVSLLPAGILKFTFFPNLEGNILEARILMPQGTPAKTTEGVVDELLEALQEARDQLPAEPEGQLVRHVRINYGTNLDAGTTGGHVATISLDLLNAELRTNSLNELRRLWLEATQQREQVMASAVGIQFKEPSIGPGGRAIDIRLQGDDLETLSKASWALQEWLQQYKGVSNLMDDLRPGKPQLLVTPKPGLLNMTIDSDQLSNQLRSAYEGRKVMDLYHDDESYEVVVKLDSQEGEALQQFYQLPIFNGQKDPVALAAIASIEEQRAYSKITRVNHRRTVTVTGDVDADLANTQEIMKDTQARFIPELTERFPSITVSLEGEVKNSQETNSSIVSGFLLALFGVYLLLAFQFGNYKEPIVVMINIPLALIGVIWGHLLMGLDLTMPSLIGFVSLAGIVVNDSILLVQFIKQHKDKMTLHEAAGEAVRGRFRAIFLTSITTMAGLYPMLLEQSLQAQVLVPLVCSIIFGMLSSTVLILFVLPCTYSLLYDLRSKSV